MATTVKIRRSGTATATPSSLEHGEIAINYADGKVFWKDASNVITSFTFQSYALASHTHGSADITVGNLGLNYITTNDPLDDVLGSIDTALGAIGASQITTGTLDAARLPLATTGAAGAVIVGTGLGVSSGTVSVTYGTTSGTACEGNDARLSDTRTPTDNTVSTAKIQDAAVTYAKIQNVSTTDRLLGRSTAGAGVVEEITCTAFGRSLIDDADAAAARTTLGVQPTASPTFTGTATLAAGAIVTSTAANSGLSVGGSSKQLRFSFAPSEGTAPTSAVTGTAYIVSADFGSGYTAMRFEATEFVFAHGIFASEVSTTFKNNGDIVMSRGQLLADDIDTAGSVAYGFDGDADTGVGRGGANVLTLVTDGTERVRVDASGNVGIGTGSGRAVAGYTFVSINGSSGAYTDYYSNGTRVGEIGAEPASFNLAAAGASTPLNLITNSAIRVTVASDGAVTMPDVYSDTVGATNRDLYIDDTGKFGYVSSIRESKTDIVTLDDVSWLSALSPVSYRYRKQDSDGNYTEEADGVTDYGLIAEDVESVKPELCFYDQVDGEPQLRGVTYSKLITPMLRYIQQLEARIAALEERLSDG
jgi:hypothetical protein